MAKRAVVLLSGGLDSTTVLALARHAGRTISALTFGYGQRHAIEIDAARRVAAAMGVSDHTLMQIDLRVLGGSALTSDIPVPKDAPLPRRGGQALAGAGRAASAARAEPTPIPVTYVPARNTIFLSYALALAEVRGATEIHVGVSAVDYSGYPDCRPEYIAAFERLAALATRVGVEGGRVRICAPLIDWTKEQIIARGLELGVDYGLTHSCYDPGARGAPCGRCESCRLRQAAFERLGRADPLRDALRAAAPRNI